jgi:hypothetical protein
MSRLRIAVAGATVLAGLAGAFLTLKADETHAPSAHPPSTVATADDAGIAIVASRSRCRLGRAPNVAEFHVVLHNQGRQDRAGRLHPSVRTRGGPWFTAEGPGRLVALLATEERAYEFDMRYDPRLGTPGYCRVSLDDGESVLIRTGHSS